jgi:hypothetical protein
MPKLMLWLAGGILTAGVALAQEEKLPNELTPEQRRRDLLTVRPGEGKCVIPMMTVKPKDTPRMPSINVPSNIDPGILRDPPLPVCGQEPTRDLQSRMSGPASNRFPRMRILPGK